MRYLSDEWVTALGAALAADPDLAATCPNPPLVIEQTIRDGTEGTVVYHLVLDRRAIRAEPGAAESPTMRFTLDLVTAVAITRGELSARAAFMEGRLRLDGDTQAILVAAPLLDKLHDPLVSLRERTEFPTLRRPG